MSAYDIVTWYLVIEIETPLFIFDILNIIMNNKIIYNPNDFELDFSHLISDDDNVIYETRPSELKILHILRHFQFQ